MRLDELFKDIEDKYEPENMAEDYEELPAFDKGGFGDEPDTE